MATEIEELKKEVHRLTLQITELVQLLKGNEFGTPGLAAQVRENESRLHNLEEKVNNALHERDVMLLNLQAGFTEKLNSASKAHDERMQKLASRVTYVSAGFTVLGGVVFAILKIFFK